MRICAVSTLAGKHPAANELRLVFRGLIETRFPLPHWDHQPLPAQAPLQARGPAGAIDALKRRRNAVILAHSPEPPKSSDVGRFHRPIPWSSPDRPALQRRTPRMIRLLWLHFMAETRQESQPRQKWCCCGSGAAVSLADACPADAFAALPLPSTPTTWWVSSSLLGAGESPERPEKSAPSNAVRWECSSASRGPILFAPDQEPPVAGWPNRVGA